MKNISLIGCTGSIGKQVIDVVSRNPEKFNIVCLVANTNADLLYEQTKLLKPEICVLRDMAVASKVCFDLDGVDFYKGEEGVELASTYEKADLVVVAVTGFAGLKITLSALNSGKQVALANKESLVVGGQLVTKLAREKGLDIIPIDSEHSALWQGLNFKRNAKYKNLILTASGGPFLKKSEDELKAVTVKEALCHPNWNMGKKITIDSATLLNKGFEVLEAMWLYNAPLEKIKTIIHPESIIHSMVEFDDGAVMAQMSYPNMRLPISLALTYPERVYCGLESLDFDRLSSLSFIKLERKKYKCYDLALTCGEKGGILPCVLNGAGEVAVSAFIEEKIPFLAIGEMIEKTLSKFANREVESYENLLSVDLEARRITSEFIK